MTEEISWDDAVSSGNYISFEEDKEKVLEIQNWKFQKVPDDAKVAAGEIELTAEVVTEDGEAVKDKVFNTTSRRLKVKLRPILEGKNPINKVKVSILKVGEKYNTQYSVKEIATTEPATAPVPAEAPAVEKKVE